MNNFYSCSNLPVRESMCFDCPNVISDSTESYKSAKSRIGTTPHRCHNNNSVRCAGPKNTDYNVNLLEQETQELVIHLMNRGNSSKR